MKEDGGPAFPFATHTQDSRGIPIAHIRDGMSLRDYFAAKAMQGLLADPNVRDVKYIPELVYKVADAMLAERAK